MHASVWVCRYVGMQNVGMQVCRMWVCANAERVMCTRKAQMKVLKVTFSLVIIWSFTLSHSAGDNSTSNKTTPSSYSLQTSLTPSRPLAEVDGLLLDDRANTEEYVSLGCLTCANQGGVQHSGNEPRKQYDTHSLWNGACCRYSNQFSPGVLNS